MCCRTRKWLQFLLPPSNQEESVLQESGLSTLPNPPQSPRPQDPTSIPSPPTSSPSASTTSPPLRHLLDETSDLIDSPVFTHVLTLLLDATFSHLVDGKIRSDAYKLAPLNPRTGLESRIVEVTDPDPLSSSTKLATILAVMTREAHKIANGLPNEYVQVIEAVNELEAFAAVVYSSNFEIETRSETITTADLKNSGSKDETAGEGKDRNDGKGLDSIKVEDVARVGGKGGIIDKTTGVVDAAWGEFERVWGKITGNGESAMRG